MNKKAYIVIVIILVAIIAVIAILISNSSNVKNNQKKTVSKDQGGNLPKLPIEVPKVDAMRVDNINDSAQIKNTFDSYVSQDYKKFRYYETDGISDVFSPSDKNVNLIPIDAFFNSVGANINPKIKDIAGKNYYGLFYCINEKKRKEYGIVFDLSDKDPTKTKSNFNSAGDAMAAWEPYLLKDIHNILFPSDKLSETDISQSLLFKDGKYRYTEVNLPNEKSSINYKVVGNPLNLIIISTSQNCISKTIGLFEALD